MIPRGSWPAQRRKLMTGMRPFFPQTPSQKIVRDLPLAIPLAQVLPRILTGQPLAIGEFWMTCSAHHFAAFARAAPT